MATIIYARVSTTRQADRELSIPAQYTIMQRYAKDHGLIVVGSFEDVASGTSLRGRPGLLKAIRTACTNRFVDTLLVHKIDRLSRNVFNYLILKGRLQDHQVQIRSVIESIEATPMGEFMEHIMAAQAEFYSANLGAEVKKGLDERRRRGLWSSSAPLGYKMEQGRLIIDPARGRFVRLAFERWATGTVTLRELNEELYQAGLVSRTGTTIGLSVLTRLLHHRIYLGEVPFDGQSHPGVHPALVTPELFDQAQAVFLTKKRIGVGPPRRHLFLLQRKVACPICGSILVGESHEKKSGKVYRYYACQRCGFRRRAEELDQVVLKHIEEEQLPERLARALRDRPIVDQAERSLASLREVFASNELVRQKDTIDLLVNRITIGAAGVGFVFTPLVEQLLVTAFRQGEEETRGTFSEERQTAG